jgi:HSP20 family protein
MPVLDKWTPLRELDLMDRRMRQFFGELGLVPPVTPAADIYETDGELVVELEVPGFDEKELEIGITDHTLLVTGERREQTLKKEKALLIRERLEKTFARRFELPPDADGEHVRAEYAKGVLTVHVPKTVHEQPRKIEIAAK